MASKGRKPVAQSKARPIAAFERADVSPPEVKKLVAEAAYFRAKQRGFAPGHELDDWVAAEAEVRRRLER